jgi:putative ABC transport system substrate-binding protein
MIGRRAFVTALAGGVLVTPRGGRAQPLRKNARHVAYLGNSSAALEVDLIEAFREGLRDLGYVEGRDIVIEYLWTEGRYDRLVALVKQAVDHRVDVIVTAGTPAVLAAKEGTSTIPIVMAAIGDPILAGIVPSLARPGGNITGLASMSPDIDGKRLELLKELVPGVSRIAVLWNPTNPNNAIRMKQIESAAKTLHLTLDPFVGASDSRQLDKGLDAIAAARAQALIMEPDRALLAQRMRIVDFTMRHQLPGLYPYREFVQAGGLVSYTASYRAMFRRAAIYIDKIFKGAKPADLPIEQPTKFELVVNLKTAKALGLTIPQSLLLRADEVLE